jgi:hypothetical protein
MPFPRINALRTIGATLAAAVVAMPILAHAQIDPAIGPMLDFLRDCSQRGKSAQECGRLAAEETKRDICRQAWMPMDECLRGLDERGSKAAAEIPPDQPVVDPDSTAGYKARTGHDYGARVEDYGTPLCAGRMTRDGCQR